MPIRIVVLASLGYFIDIIDLFMFSVVRVASLRSLGVPETELLSAGVFVLDCQMAGLLLGGVIWGILADKRGRLRVLYGSILLYSLATLANAFVTNVPLYGVCRFVSGFGLAGELGAAITLVSETLSSKNRGYGTMIVGGVGLSGGTIAALLAQYYSWSTCYLIGGSAGLALLLLRLKLREPALFLEIHDRVDRGNLLLLFRSGRRVARFIYLILVGLPIWYVAGILMIFAPELGHQLGIEGVSAAKAVLYSYIGVAIGDVISGAYSQWAHSRKKAVAWSLVGIVIMVPVYLGARGISLTAFYGVCFIMGLTTGYWAILITMASEHFGTNLRATVTTSVPNLVRGSVIPMTFLLQMLMLGLPLVPSAALVGALALGLAFFGLWRLDETFARDLAFVET